MWPDGQNRTLNPMQKTAMHHGSVVSLRFEGKWPPRGEHFASRYGFSILAIFVRRERHLIFSIEQVGP